MCGFVREYGGGNLSLLSRISGPFTGLIGGTVQGTTCRIVVCILVGAARIRPPWWLGMREFGDRMPTLGRGGAAVSSVRAQARAPSERARRGRGEPPHTRPRARSGLASGPDPAPLALAWPRTPDLPNVDR